MSTAPIDHSHRRVYTPKPITLGRAVGFGVLDLMGGGWNTIISGLLLYFFVTYGDVTAVEAGTILFVARIVDAVVSLAIGPLTDNFYRTRLGRRFGRRHFFLLVGAPLLLVVFPLLWVSHRGFWYYLVVYLAVEIVMAMILIPWETLPTEMTSDYTERTKLSGARMFLSATGTFIVFLLPAQLKAADNPDAYFITGLVFSALFATAVAITYFTTWERQLTPEFVAALDRRARVQVGQAIVDNFKAFGSTFANSSFRKLLGIYLFSFTGKDIFATALIFFVVYSIQGSESFGLTLQALSIVGLPVTLLAGVLMVRNGPRYLWALSFGLISASLLAVGGIYLLQPASTAVLLVLVGIVYQAGRALLEFTPWNVFPFIPDVDRIMTGEDRAGIYAAVMTFGRKSTGAFGTLIVSWLLDLGGFIRPGTPGGVQIDPACTQACPLVQTAMAAHTIALVVVFCPLILIVIAFVISRSMHLNATTHEVLRIELDRLAGGGSTAEVTAETRAVVETLTGHAYDGMWRWPGPRGACTT